jgi:hypothetical protein
MGMKEALCQLINNRTAVKRALRTRWEGKKIVWNEAKIQVKSQRNWRAFCNTSKPLSRK